jgi:hypothetical protein
MPCSPYDVVNVSLASRDSALNKAAKRAGVQTLL